MVVMGPAPPVPAHAQGAIRGNPLAPHRDRATEAPRGRAPPVPRAPRAAPKAQSAGALTREMRRRPSSCDPTGRSEARRPREGSPFSTISKCDSERSHLRVASLQREVHSVENQVSFMGPARPDCEAAKKDHSRGHRLGQEYEANSGVPWQPPRLPQDQHKSAGRSHTLRNENQAADQALEWGPSALPGAGPREYVARVNMLAREEKELAGAGEYLPGAARNAAPIAADGVHGRRNIMNREFASEQSKEMPRAAGYHGDVPTYGRASKLSRENPGGFLPKDADRR